MQIRLRQICLAARDLRAVMADLEAVLAVTPCHGIADLTSYGIGSSPLHPGGRSFMANLKLENVLYPIGSGFLEVVAPISDDAPVLRYLDRRKGDSGYMVISQVDSVAPIRANAERAGVRVITNLRLPDYENVQLHPGDSGGAMLEFAQQLTGGSDAWYPGGHGRRPTDPPAAASGFLGATLQSPDPERLARRWGTIMGLPVEAGDGAWRLQLANAVLTFVTENDGRGEGLSRLAVVVDGPERVLASARDRSLRVQDAAVEIGGVWFDLVQA